jgi:hypothetical protein
MSACKHCGRTGRFYRDEPRGYFEWHAWAEKLSRRYHQEQCPGCGRFTIWRRGAAPRETGE